MDLKFGDIQETALIPLAIKASETARPDARIKDPKAKEIIDTLGVDLPDQIAVRRKVYSVSSGICRRSILTFILR